MQFISADVSVLADFDHGEGWVVFTWLAEGGASSSLMIDMDHHCSREMPLRSGSGPPHMIGLERDRLTLHFPNGLAAKLDLGEFVEFQFSVDDSTYNELRRFGELWPDFEE